jgi:hypothetical protein
LPNERGCFSLPQSEKNGISKRFEVHF